jgi:transposase
MYACIAEHHTRGSISLLCEVLQASCSGLSAYQRRQARAVVDRSKSELFARVQAIAAETRQRYGSRRMAKQLQEEGFAMGRAKARHHASWTYLSIVAETQFSFAQG